MAVRTGNENKGTWLRSIQEGASPHESPAPDVYRMRVAESRPFYNKLVEERKTRQIIRAFYKQGEQIGQAHQKQAEAAQEKKDLQWPDPTFSTSSSEEDSAVDINATISPLNSTESPPSAPEISPPLPSPPEEPQTSRLSSPSASPQPDLPQSATNSSSPTQPELVWVATPPNRQDVSPALMVSSLPTKKRGRGRPKKDQKADTLIPANRLGRPTKVTKQQQMPTTPVPSRRFRQISAEPQTPVQEQTPSGRSARMSAFKGSYKC
jgi:hypothetical protein